MAKQKLGQHFLFDKNILKKIASNVKNDEDKNVLEIGAGLGTLTEFLLEKFEHVYAVEIDATLCQKLSLRFRDCPKLTIINNDILHTTIETLPVTSAVGNIPYYITTPIIFKLLEIENIRHFGLLMQKEVAKRVVAKPGSKDYGILSVNVQFQADVKMVFPVGKGCFSPPPKVDSSFLFFKKKNVPQAFAKALRMLTQKAFGMRRKTLLNNLKNLLGDETEKFIRAAGIPPTIRAEDIELETFVKMTEILLKKGVF